MLAIIARSGSQGVSRDRLLAMLWPESDEERARSALNQALYALRRDVGERDLTLGTSTLRLNPHVITSDALEFERALDAGRNEAAVRSYRGPFLDGVHIGSTVELERWIDEQRDRLARRCTAALEELAERAAKDGDTKGAVEWWGRLAGLDPLNSKTALRFAQALAAAGDRAGALRHASKHEAAMREDLGLPPDPGLARLVGELQTTPPPTSLGGDSTPPRSAPASAVDLKPRSTVPRTRRWSWIVAGGLLLVGTALTAHTVMRPAEPALDRNVIAVMPFDVTSTTPALRHLGNDLVVLFWMKLTGDVGPRALDPGTVLSYIQRDSGTPPTLARALETARHFGAGRVVLGAVSGTRARVQVTAQLLDVPSGRQLATYSVAAAADTIPAAVDTLALWLLTTEYGASTDRLPQLARYKLAAVREFLAGQGQAASADCGIACWPAAQAHFANALREDSTFVEAGLASYSFGEGDTALLRWTWEHRAALSERDRLLLQVYALCCFIPGSRGIDRITLLERAVAQYPEWGEARVELANTYLNEGGWAGIPNWSGRARAILEPLIEESQPSGFSLSLLLAATAVGDDTIGVRRVSQLLPRAYLSPGRRAFMEWRAARVLGDSAALHRIWSVLDTSGLATEGLPQILAQALVDGRGLADAEHALARLRTLGHPSPEWGTVLDFEAGRYDEWLAVRAQGLAAFPPELAAATLIRDALYLRAPANNDVDEAVRYLRGVRAGRSHPGPTPDQMKLADCWLAQWDLAHGRAGEIESIVRRFKNTRSESYAVCASLLEFQLAERSGGDLRTAALKLDSTARSVAFGGEPPLIGLQNQILAQTFLRLHDAPRALAAARRRCYDLFCGWEITWPGQVLAEARAAVSVGDTAAGIRAYDWYLSLREKAEGPWRPEADSAKAELARLVAR